MRNQWMADGLGLIVPINIEAMCVTKNTGAVFTPAPYNFTLLPNGKQTDVPNLSEKVMTGTGNVNIGAGVHLHWALPDGLTRGTTPQDNTGKVVFPRTPDRWLITRVFTDLSNPLSPVNKVKSWVVESNYISEKQPDQKRRSISVPFKTSDADGPQYRFMGRVQEFETWHAQYMFKQNNPGSDNGEEYVEGLSAVGYGVPEFSASYQSCQSIFGFHDTDTELDTLGADIMLSYHIAGWYHNLVDDPMSQIPLQFDPLPFNEILAKISSGDDKALLQNAYRIKQVNGPFVLADNISAALRLQLMNILSTAGFDFLDHVLKQCRWSLPSGTGQSDLLVTHTILTGIISPVNWNKDKDSFKDISEQINISVGNTSSQALAALIAAVSGSADPDSVEMLLDALQLGKLKNVTDIASLNRLEELAIALHTSGYNSTGGGGLWEVTKLEDADQETRLTGMAQSLGADLNKLNELQLAYDQGINEIASLRSQIFMDWYRFMLILRRGNNDPDHGFDDPGDLAGYIKQEIVDDLDVRVSKTTTAEIDVLAGKIREQLPPGYELVNAGAARYWQPAEPVILFQGKDIDPPQRYGGDGRFMADKTLVCRLSPQVITSLEIPAGITGYKDTLLFNGSNTPGLPASVPLSYGAQVQALFTESILLNPFILSGLCIANGATENFQKLTATIRTNRDAYLSPPVASRLAIAEVERIKRMVNDSGFEFFLTCYRLEGDYYLLQGSVTSLPEDTLKRLKYLFISARASWGTALTYTGLAPSEVYFVDWNGNPWLPFSFSWNVTYYPFESIDPSANRTDYQHDFIYKNFRLGDVNYVPVGQLTVPPVYQAYRNSIFMSPHAEENFQVQIQKFIAGQQDGPVPEELKELLTILKDFPPVLSQSLNGINDAMVMRNQVMQLDIKDPVPSPVYNQFSNVLVRNAVAGMSQSAPSPSNFYNPIRAGLMSLSSLTIVDVFGRNITIETPGKIIVAKSLKAAGLPANYIYLPPRIVQPSRLQFRWLAADSNSVQMNSHPSTTAICGWILANHLESSLWFYNNNGIPFGSLILSEDRVRVIWQGTPGSSSFGLNINTFFDTPEGREVNSQLKMLALALYNGGNDGSYLDAFIRANDTTYSLIQPENYSQMGSNAVLIGSPIAVARASLSLDLMGLPSYNNSWQDLLNEVENGAPKNDNHFTKVEFPVRLGNMKEVNDGLLGYFKDGDYGHYFAVHTNKDTDRVSEPSETNITLTLDPSSNNLSVTLLLDPRGCVHATTGVLPVKKITIPPSHFADALESLEIAFLTSPVLYNGNKPALPVPADGGAEWTWLQNELTKWSESQTIGPVDDKATMSDLPQEIKEGWLLLKNFSK